MNPSVNEKIADKWLSRAVDALTHVGYFVLEGVLDERMIEATREALLGTQRKIVEEVGRERLDRAGELGVLRLMMKYDPHFYDFLAIPEMLAALDTYLAPTAVLHTQNGFVLPSLSANETPRIFQNMYHQDFPRSLDGYLASLNTMFAISEFTAKSGATYVVPGSHQSRERPSNEYLECVPRSHKSCERANPSQRHRLRRRTHNIPDLPSLPCYSSRSGLHKKMECRR